MKFEQLVENEELEKQNNNEKNREVKIEKLKANADCLERDERVEEAEERSSLETSGANDLIKSLKGAIKEMITGQRNKESDKINVMRKMKDKQRNR